MKLYQQCVGEGPDLVLLHGWGLHSGIWSASRDNLLDRLSRNYRVTMFDLPGHGYSSDIGEPGFDATISMIAEQLPPTSLLLGWSLGGLLALQLACQFRQRISALILIASNARFTRTSDWPAAMAAETLNSFGAALLENPASTVQRFLALQVLGSERQHEQLQLLKQTMNERPVARQWALQRGLEMLRDIDLRDRLALISQPALLIYGQHDRIVPDQSGATMAHLMPQARVLSIKGAGHAPFLSHHEQTGQVISDFLDT